MFTGAKYFGSLPSPWFATREARELLTCDRPLEAWPAAGVPADAFPGEAFLAARNDLAAGRRDAAIAQWLRIAERKDAASSDRAQAWHFLRSHGHPAPPAGAGELLGVVLDLWVMDAFDVLAVYADRTVHFHSHNGAVAVWDRPDTTLDREVDAFLERARAIVDATGVWEGGPLELPEAGNIRLSFLTPGGLHFGQGPARIMWDEPTAGPLMRAARVLLAKLAVQGG